MNHDPLNPSPAPVMRGNGSPLPVGWTVTEYPSTFDIHDHTGRFITCFPKPYSPAPLGELIKTALVGKVRWMGKDGEKTISATSQTS